MDSHLVPIGDVAAALGVSVSQVRKLTNEGRLSAVTTDGGHRRYDLAQVLHGWSSGSQAVPAVFDRTAPRAGLQEHLVWRELRSVLGSALGEAAQRILGYATTEMINNAVDHSDGREVRVSASDDAGTITIVIADDGVGAFDRMVSKLGLPDRYAAIQELSKGKATTSPDRHTGEGIFFTSKAVDRFRLAANGLVWLVDNLLHDTSVAASRRRIGTEVTLELAGDTTKSMKDVFDEFTVEDRFARTRPAVKLLEYGTEFISRSEAKRLAQRLEEFQEVELDFEGVGFVGQGFVDEMFRVWARDHPDTRLIPINMNDEVAFMVRRGLTLP